MEVKRVQIGWGFWLQWVLASIAGWIMGGAAAFRVPGPVSVAVLGAAIGIAQWLALRRQVSRAGWWVLASTVGFVALLVGSPAASFVDWLVDAPAGWTMAAIAYGAAHGAAVGIMQWLVLRRQIPHAGLWVSASITGWSVGWAVQWMARVAVAWPDILFGVITFGLLAAIIAAPITGIALVGLLRGRVPIIGHATRRKIIWAAVGLVSVSVIALLVTRPQAVTYKGLALPALEPVKATFPLVPPPPVWLIVGDEVTPATLVVFGGGGLPGQPPGSPDLATATLQAEAQAVIVVGLKSPEGFQAIVRPWSDDGADSLLFDTSGRELKAETQRNGHLMVFTLEPIGDENDQFLIVHISFPRQQGFASYAWRLNPAK